MLEPCGIGCVVNVALTPEAKTASLPASTVVRAHSPSAGHAAIRFFKQSGSSITLPPGPPVPAPPLAPPADVPPAEAPPADVPPAEAPPADVPPAEAPPADVPAPPAVAPVPVVPPLAPPADVPPAEAPPADVPAPPAVAPVPVVPPGPPSLPGDCAPPPHPIDATLKVAAMTIPLISRQLLIVDTVPGKRDAIAKVAELRVHGPRFPDRNVALRKVNRARP